MIFVVKPVVRRSPEDVVKLQKKLYEDLNAPNDILMKTVRNGLVIMRLLNHLVTILPISEQCMRLQKTSVDQIWLPQPNVSETKKE